MEAKKMPFDDAEANKRIRAHGAKLAEESAKWAHEQWVADRNKYIKDGVYVPPVTYKRPSQELMDQIQKRNEAKKKHDKEEGDKAFARSVQRLKGVKGGRRTKRHKRSGHNKRSGRMSRRR
jgi:hypothetical protein